MQLLPLKAALAIAAVTHVALNARSALIRRPIQEKALAMHLQVAERYLEPLLQALVRHTILKSTRGPRGGYDLAREERRITADDIVRAASTLTDRDWTPLADSALLTSVMPLLGQAEHAFSDALAKAKFKSAMV